MYLPSAYSLFPGGESLLSPGKHYLCEHVLQNKK